LRRSGCFRASTVTHHGEPDRLDCYAGLLNQAAMNLIGNAIDGTVATLRFPVAGF
jgi:signal transduction histidine kinase